jgi:hypothetical protein
VDVVRIRQRGQENLHTRIGRPSALGAHLIGVKPPKMVPSVCRTSGSIPEKSERDW